MPRFLCTGDLHLGAGSDLGREPGDRLAEQAAVWLQIVDQANALGATILFAGDAWERRRPTPVELLAFRTALHWLKFPLIGVAGNHDVEAFKRPTGYDVFLLPSGSGRASVYAAPKLVPTAGALVACLPWAPPTHLVALEGGGDRDDLNRRLAEGLVEIARGLYAEAKSGEWADRPIVLLTHWSISGATASSGIPVELFREPVLDAAALEAIGFDAIVAGHIHRPQMIGERSFYVGSPMPLNFGEAGHAHTVWMLDVEPGSFQAFQIPVPSRRLVTLDVEVNRHDGWENLSDVTNAIVKARLRMTQEQARRIDVGALKAELLGSGAYKVWSIQTEIERPAVARGAAIDETITDTAALELYLEALSVNGDQAEALLDRHARYLERLAA